MSFDNIDEMPRLKDTCRPEDLDTGACIALAETVLREASAEYIHSRRALERSPGDKGAALHLQSLRNFYLSDYFQALCAGTADGDAVLRELDNIALGK